MDTHTLQNAEGAAITEAHTHTQQAAPELKLGVWQPALTALEVLDMTRPRRACVQQATNNFDHQRELQCPHTSLRPSFPPRVSVPEDR